MSDIIPVVKSSFLTAEQFEKLSDVPPEIEWLANITNQKTRRAYKIDVSEFSLFTGIQSSQELRTITRAHVIACRKDLEAREVPLPTDDRFNARFHFAIDYKPDLATNVVGSHSLPCPPGMSGSAVWNTGFVESRMAGESWTPESARITGIVWAWPSSSGCIVATRSEYVRSFLLSVSCAGANSLRQGDTL
jgi:hypothetical protein